MKKLALTLPWLSGTAPTKITINNTSPGISNNLGALISGFGNIAFSVGGFLMLMWFSWGVFQYIFAGGDKEKLARARARITWALIGFVILIVMFFVSDYLKTIFLPKVQSGVTSVIPPPDSRSEITPIAPTKEGCSESSILQCGDVDRVCKAVNGSPVCVTPGSKSDASCPSDQLEDCQNAGRICKEAGTKFYCVDR